MDLKCSLETKTSKSGSDYQCIVIQLVEGYEKIVFLDKAELALLNQSNNGLQKGVNPFDIN